MCKRLQSLIRRKQNVVRLRGEQGSHRRARLNPITYMVPPEHVVLVLNRHKPMMTRMVSLASLHLLRSASLAL